MRGMISGIRAVLLCAGLTGLAACTTQQTLTDEITPLGDFRLGYNIVVADNAQLIPPSRGAEPEEWENAIQNAVAARFGRYTGEKLYHFGIAVDGFALAVPGVPVVLSPKSALVISVNIYDDSQADNGANGKLTEKPKQITVLESISGNTFIGSGLTQSKEQQMQNLAFNAARLIEDWLVENGEEWFGQPPVVVEPAPAETPITTQAIEVSELPAETGN